MDFDLPADLVAYLRELDAFIAREIVPLQARDDHQRFFDHRREWARTDFDNDGLPRPEWEALLKQVRRLADAAGHLRFALPKRIRRPGRQQPVDGRDPRAPGGQGPGPAQRPADRTFDRRQQPLRADAARLRHARAAGRVHRRHAERALPRHLRPDRSRARLRRHAHGNAWPCPRRATASPAGASTARRCGPPACTRPATACCSRAAAARPATRAASAPSSCRRKRRA